jgi:hypothetical protein
MPTGEIIIWLIIFGLVAINVIDLGEQGRRK